MMATAIAVMKLCPFALEGGLQVSPVRLGGVLGALLVSLPPQFL